MSLGSVLVIDDDEWVGRLLAVALRETGYTVHISGNAVDGHDKAVEVQPDCIICDVDLPDVDGFWVARKIRMSPGRLSQTPIVFLSGLDDRDTRLQGFQVGADVFMTKPFRIDEVVAQVGALMQMAVRLRGVRTPTIAPSDAAMVGDIGQMSISTVLTILDMERRSGRLNVSKRGHEVKFVISRGAVSTAVLDGTPGDPVLIIRELLGWLEGKFSFRPDEENEVELPREHSINALLMEAVRQDDEARVHDDPSPSSRALFLRFLQPADGEAAGATADSPRPPNATTGSNAVVSNVAMSAAAAAAAAATAAATAAETSVGNITRVTAPLAEADEPKVGTVTRVTHSGPAAPSGSPLPSTDMRPRQDLIGKEPPREPRPLPPPPAPSPRAPIGQPAKPLPPPAAPPPSPAQQTPAAAAARQSSPGVIGPSFVEARPLPVHTAQPRAPLPSVIISPGVQGGGAPPPAAPLSPPTPAAPAKDIKGLPPPMMPPPRQSNPGLPPPPEGKPLPLPVPSPKPAFTTEARTTGTMPKPLGPPLSPGLGAPPPPAPKPSITNEAKPPPFGAPKPSITNEVKPLPPPAGPRPSLTNENKPPPPPAPKLPGEVKPLGGEVKPLPPPAAPRPIPLGEQKPLAKPPLGTKPKAGGDSEK